MQIRILGLGLVLGLTAASAALLPKLASASPAYTQKTGLACAVCHASGRPASAESVTAAGGDFMACRMNDGCISRWVATLSPPGRGDRSSTPPPARPYAGQDRWGSIAAADDRGDAPGAVERWGVGRGASRDAAEADALAHCRGSGFGGCEVKVSFKNQCGVYASSKKHSGVGVGPTIDQAADRALSDCGKSSCVVALKACASN